MNNGLGFSEREIEIIKKRYPIVDIENPDIPPVGLSTISSLDYLESAVRFDIANMISYLLLKRSEYTERCTDRQV